MSVKHISTVVHFQPQFNRIRLVFTYTKRRRIVGVGSENRLGRGNVCFCIAGRSDWQRSRFRTFLDQGKADKQETDDAC